MRRVSGFLMGGVGRVRTASGLVLLSVLLTGGCKTSGDAAAAATQLTSTAKSLTAYYAALDTLLTETDELYQLQAAMNPLAPYDAPTKAYVLDTKKEVEKREAVAAALTSTAQEFSSLSGSTAGADTGTAAGNLESAITALKLSKWTMSSSDVNLMKEAADQVVQAIQEHKEREAARAIDQLASALDTWFLNEEPSCNTIGATYAKLSKSLAKALIAKGQVDSSAVLTPVLSPYGLTPILTDTTLKAQVQTVLASQVDDKSTALVNTQTAATTSMEKALGEMSKRIHLVATDKPMAMRGDPITLAEVQSWIALVPQIAPVPKTN